MCYDLTRSRVVLFGGDSHADLENGTPLGDTWEWDGSFWTQMDDVGPAPRSSSSMVYDSARNVSILFGGRSVGLLLGDTWQWDGTDWTQLSESGPSPRAASAMAFDSARNRTVLFAGGSKENPCLSDTWEFDGENWTQQQDTGPLPRAAHAMAFDSVSNRVILFGGIDLNNDGLGDTWAWDGSEWVQIAEFGPPPRLNAALASAGGSNLILFGGLNAFGQGKVEHVFADTWEFDGKRWTQRQEIGPGRLQNAAIAFDSSRGRMVLFGGLAPGDQIRPDFPSGFTWETAAPVVAPPVLKLSSITVPPRILSGSPFGITFTLNGPAPAGGTVVLVGTALLTPAGDGPLLKVTVNPGLTAMTVGASIFQIGIVTIHAGVALANEVEISVDVQ
jgi:hypothetical protein